MSVPDLIDDPVARAVTVTRADAKKTTRQRFAGQVAQRLTPAALAVRALQLALAVVVILVWEWKTGNPSTETAVWFDELFVGKPSGIWHEVVELYDEGTLFVHAWTTLQEMLIGFFIGGLGGVATGVLIGVNRLASAVLTPFMTALYSVPRLALTPMFILWFGLGMESKIALVATIVYFIFFYNAYAGARDVNAELLDVLRVMQANRAQLHLKVTLPSVATWMIASLRVAVPYAFVAAVVGEMLAANRGLGYLIVTGSSTFNSNAMFAAIVIVVILSLCLNAVVTVVERRLLRWKVGGDRVGLGL